MVSESKKPVAKSGEVYAYFIEKLSKYCVYQIIRTNKESICYVALNYLEPSPPTADILDKLQPYYRQSFRYHHHMEKSWIENNPVPRDYIFVGECDLKTDDSCNSYSGVWPKGEAFIYEERWKGFGEEAIAAYKKYINSGDFVSLHGQMFKKNMGGLVDSLYTNLTEQDSPKLFPCITYAEVTGYSGKLEKWLCEAPLLGTLRLKEAGVETIDLSKTHLDYLELNMTGVTTLVLPHTIESLKIYGEISRNLHIDDSRCGGKIDFTMVLKNSEVGRYGMEHVKVHRLILGDISELDMAHVAESFPEIESIWMIGKPGSVVNIQALGKLHNLKCIDCSNLFGYTASDLEPLQVLPNLCELDFDSIPKEAGTYLKKFWKGKLDRLSVTHLRNEGWLKENLDNPLRHWDGSEFVPKAAYKKVIKCYKETKKQLEAAATKSQVEDIVRQYTIHFNNLNAKYDEFIETEEREDIFMAMKQLYEESILHGEYKEADEKKVMISLEEIWDIMDGEREDW